MQTVCDIGTVRCQVSIVATNVIPNPPYSCSLGWPQKSSQVSKTLILISKQKWRVLKVLNYHNGPPNGSIKKRWSLHSTKDLSSLNSSNNLHYKRRLWIVYLVFDVLENPNQNSSIFSHPNVPIHTNSFRISLPFHC